MDDDNGGPCIFLTKPGDLGRLRSGGVRLRIFGLVDFAEVGTGGRVEGRACDGRKGERGIEPTDGLKGGRCIELCREGEIIDGLRCEGNDGDT